MIDLSGVSVDDLLFEINRRFDDEKNNINDSISKLMKNIDNITGFSIKISHITIKVNSLFVEFAYDNTSYPKIKCYYQDNTTTKQPSHRYIDKNKITSVDYFIDFLKLFDNAEYKIYKEGKQPLYHGYYDTFYGWFSDKLKTNEIKPIIFY
jgi:hypothetical protein